MSVQRALMILLAAVLAAALLPSALLLERRLGAAIEDQVRADLTRAPAILAESRAQSMDALMMHAKEIASVAGLADALMRGDLATARDLVEAARAGYGEEAVLITAGGDVLAGPRPPDTLLALTRAGGMPVEIVPDGTGLRTVALAPVKRQDDLAGIAGVSVMFGETEARALAGLTRAEVLVLDAGLHIRATTVDPADTAILAAAARARTEGDAIGDVRTGDRRLLLTTTSLGDWATVAFVRDLSRDRAILGALGRIAGALAILAAVLALTLGAFFSMRLTRPIRSLASAADRLAGGDFHAPIERSRLAEVGRMADAFDAMRNALAGRLEDLAAANRELADRQARLSALQAELIQRDRLVAAGRLVAQLAHEVRNPVANVRNCLELIRRRIGDDDEARAFADLAIDELLRMHELAEQMLDLNRPRDTAVRDADVAGVAAEVAALVAVGTPASLVVDVHAPPGLRAAVPPDSLKQVLLNLVQNAREAMHERGTINIRARAENGSVVIDVSDTGPGIPADVLPRVFDPFFTTKGGVHSVGLGLFVADGMIRGVGGRITAVSRGADGGACFTLTLPAAAPAVALTSAAEIA